MRKPSLFDSLSIDFYSATPKYLQLSNAFNKAIREGRLRANDPLPSINELSFELEISRDTAEKGYKHLKKLHILGSVPGKGYYVRNTDVNQQYKICLLFNKLSPHKKIMYDSFAAALGETAVIDFYIYNNDFALFKKLLGSKLNDYTHYVIVPHFLEGGERAHEIINTIPKEKLILMDKLVKGVEGTYGAVFENFEKDIFESLEKALPRLQQYAILKIIFPEYTYHPKEILNGFNRFCHQYQFRHKLVHNICKEPVSKGEAYINLMEDDLVYLIEKILENKLTVGSDVGVISYNETPMKKIILNGITTISTDFQLMGEQAAQLILGGSTEHVEIPFYLTLRASL